MEIRGLYAIADNQFNPYPTIPQYVEQLLLGGVPIVQLRMKSSPVLAPKIAREVMDLKKHFSFNFIVNDYVDVAIEVGADGVHVGKNDASIKEVKAKLPKHMIVGYSSHSLEEAVEAEKAGADYVAFGAIYPTPTKGPGHPVQGTDALKSVVESLTVPVVAIGGIGRANVDAVLRTGASSVAMITALSHATSIVEETRWFVDRMNTLL